MTSRIRICAAALAFVALAAAPAAAQQPPRCSQPTSSGDRPTASDCLVILRVAVGVQACEPECICAPKGSLPTSATDALVCLSSAVGQPAVLACPCAPPSTTSSTSSTTTTSTTLVTGPAVLAGVLLPTTGRFNYDLTIGLPGAEAACGEAFPGSHVCTAAELVAAEAAGDLGGAKDLGGTAVTSFWAIDPDRPDDDQCTVVLAWDYQTAHTGQFADRYSLDNPSGTLGPLQSGVVCASSSWVGCCR